MSMRRKLYRYQEENVKFALSRPAAIIGDEMGLGKTTTALAVAEAKKCRAVLVVSPKSVIPMWLREIEACCSIPAFAYPSPIPTDSERFIYLINWDIISKQLDNLTKVNWSLVIADEAHKAKNRKAQRTRALKLIPTESKLALTGTPIINRPDELWSILNWLDKRNFRSYWRFFEEYVAYQRAWGGYYIIHGAKNEAALRKLLSDWMIRHEKKDVLRELPDKYYTILPVELSPKQRDMYEEMRQAALVWLDESKDDRIEAVNALSKLTRLRQICCGTPYIGESGDIRLSLPSTKVDALLELLDNMTGKVVIFTMFRDVVSMVEEATREKGIQVVTFMGGATEKERRQALERFQEDDKVKAFVGTIQSGGVGLNLQNASTAVFMDRSWSPADNLQAEDRLHRIGQKNAVHIINIQAEGTVDTYMQSVLLSKASMVRSILAPPQPERRK